MSSISSDEKQDMGEKMARGKLQRREMHRTAKTGGCGGCLWGHDGS